MAWEVTGAAAVVQVAGMSRYLSRGDRIPAEADEASVKHLADVGLISEVGDEPEPVAEPTVEADAEVDGDKPKPTPRKR